MQPIKFDQASLLPKKLLYPIVFLIGIFVTYTEINAATYYVSPSGNDNNSGTSTSQPWATFDRGLSTNASGNKLQPGDTLIIMNGIYYQSLIPHNVPGQAGNPITVKAQNDGQATLDGQVTRDLIVLEKWRQGNYYVFEGLVLKNAVNKTIHVSGGANNNFHRITAYNANTDTNSAVIGIGGDYNLIEDCVAAGTGRKMLYTYKGVGNVVRRCFTYWTDWEGKTWHDAWPWGDGIQVYNGSDNIFENNINFGLSALWGYSVQNNSGGPPAIYNNKVLGSISMNSGMAYNGTDWQQVAIFGCPVKSEPCKCVNSPVDQWCIDNNQVGVADRPQPAVAFGVRDFDWPTQRAGFVLFGSYIDDTLFQDVFAYNNAGTGLGAAVTGNINNTQVNRATLINNGLDLTAGHIDGNQGTDLSPFNVSTFQITNSDIEGTSYQGEGARLVHRYVNGVLKDGSDGTPAQNLWPWPMENRIKTEFAQMFGIQNFSVTCELGKLINQHTNNPITYLDVNAYCTGTAPTSTPTPIVSLTPTFTPSPTPTPTPGGGGSGPTPTPTSIPIPTPTPTPLPGGLIVTASSFQSPNFPQNTLDGDLNTRWSTQGDGEWIQYQYPNTVTFQSVNLAFYSLNTESYFDILVSDDGTNWTTLLSNQIGTSPQLQPFDFPDTDGRYLRIVGHGSLGTNWNSITEVQLITDTLISQIHQLLSNWLTPVGDRNADNKVNSFDYLDLISG